jgi:Tfp pilus assembly protein PilV
MHVNIQKLEKSSKVTSANFAASYKFTSGGWSLLEVLISLFVLTFALLTFADIELVALQQMQNSYFASLAASQVSNMAECLHGDHSIAENYFSAWNQDNSRLLPSGTGKYTVQKNGYNISICWFLHSKTKKKFCYGASV